MEGWTVKLYFESSRCHPVSWKGSLLERLFVSAAVRVPVRLIPTLVSTGAALSNFLESFHSAQAIIPVTEKYT